MASGSTSSHRVQLPCCRNGGSMHHRRPYQRLIRMVLRIVTMLLALQVFPRPAGAQPDPRYWRYDDMVNQLHSWALEHPDIVHLEAIGTTLVGAEPIWAIKISDNPAVDEPEKTIIFHAAQHANEPNGTGVCMRMIQRLLEEYGSVYQTTVMVNTMQIWFVPIVNVDGHRMAFSNMPKWFDWRKNKRDNNHDWLYTCPDDGVDLNRNWDFHWDQQGDSSSADQYYRGTAPFSEPEARAMRDFILRERPVMVMDFHSPYENSSGNVIYWTWINVTGYGPDKPFFEPIAQSMAAHTQSEVDTVWYRAGAGAVTLSKEQNWVYANTGTCVFLMEISTAGFWRGATVDTIAARAARGSWTVLDRAYWGPGLTGQVVDAVTGHPLEARVEIEEAFDPGIGPHTTDPADGTFWRVLTEGDYTLIVSADGYYRRTGPIHIGPANWALSLVQLIPLNPAVAGDQETDSGRDLWAENPARRSTLVHFKVKEDGQPIRLLLVDTAGRIVQTLAEGRYPAGIHDVPLREVPAGVYLLRMQADGRTIARKVVAGR
jgi:hypothetical protein